MKGNDFFRGDKCVLITPNDFIDNVPTTAPKWNSTTTYTVGQVVAADQTSYPAWVTSTPYLVGSIVTNAGALWLSLTAHTDAVAPVGGTGIWIQITSVVYWKALQANTNVPPTEDGVNWTKAGTNFTTLPSVIFCAGVSGTIKVTCADGTVLALPATAILASGFLFLGNLRVTRVWATGTSATVLYAVAE